MQIDKILVIESPVHLWKILRAKEEIIDIAREDIGASLRCFMDCVDIYINGCKCSEETNYGIMISQFEAIKEESIINHLINGLECDKIEFK